MYYHIMSLWVFMEICRHKKKLFIPHDRHKVCSEIRVRKVVCKLKCLTVKLDVNVAYMMSRYS